MRLTRLSRGSLLQRETFLLIVLCLLAIAGFFATRAAAAANRQMHRRDATHFYDDGRAALERRDTANAVPALRHAVAMDRENRTYRLTLADALVAADDVDVARNVLLRVREEEPEDPDVNLRLARLETRAKRPGEAIRYYENALVELWRPEQASSRHQVRVELIEFLLAQGAQNRALAESLALASESADEPAAQVEAGRLLLRSGAPTRALPHFDAVLQRDPDNGNALAGAAEAAFDAAEYERARRYLARAPDSPRTAELRTLTVLILSSDPLLPHLTATERDRRVRAALEAVTAEIDACGAGGATLTAEAAALKDSLRRRGRSSDTLGADLGAVARLAQRASAACGVHPIDRALSLIARRHGVDQP